ncbi:MAG: hypothetical protein ABIR37_04880 [Candidatus Saccharimonadales bacterium]
MSENGKYLSEMYEGFIRERRLLNFTANAGSIVIAGLSVVNFELVPDERMKYTYLPLLGAAAMQGAKYAGNALISKVQDKILQHQFPIQEENN